MSLILKAKGLPLFPYKSLILEAVNVVQIDLTAEALGVLGVTESPETDITEEWPLWDATHLRLQI
jgi:hypothetical protein